MSSVDMIQYHVVFSYLFVAKGTAEGPNGAGGFESSQKCGPKIDFYAMSSNAWKVMWSDKDCSNFCFYATAQPEASRVPQSTFIPSGEQLTCYVMC